MNNVYGCLTWTVKTVPAVSLVHNPPYRRNGTCRLSRHLYHSLLPQFSLLWGLPGLDQDREDLQGRLRLAETRAEELAESLRAVTSSMEQYKAMAQSLEESLDKEKQVQNQPDLPFSIEPVQGALTITANVKWMIEIDFIYILLPQSKKQTFYSFGQILLESFYSKVQT